MIFKILFQFFLGYTKIEVEGYYIEKFLNKCINKGQKNNTNRGKSWSIRLWKIKKYCIR